MCRISVPYVSEKEMACLSEEQSAMSEEDNGRTSANFYGPQYARIDSEPYEAGRYPAVWAPRSCTDSSSDCCGAAGRRQQR